MLLYLFVILIAWVQYLFLIHSCLIKNLMTYLSVFQALYMRRYCTVCHDHTHTHTYIHTCPYLCMHAEQAHIGKKSAYSNRPPGSTTISVRLRVFTRGLTVGNGFFWFKDWVVARNGL